MKNVINLSTNDISKLYGMAVAAERGLNSNDKSTGCWIVSMVHINIPFDEVLNDSFSEGGIKKALTHPSLEVLGAELMRSLPDRAFLNFSEHNECDSRP